MQSIERSSSSGRWQNGTLEPLQLHTALSSGTAADWIPSTDFSIIPAGFVCFIVALWLAQLLRFDQHNLINLAIDGSLDCVISHRKVIALTGKNQRFIHYLFSIYWYKLMGPKYNEHTGQSMERHWQSYKGFRHKILSTFISKNTQYWQS